jgi:hypothetical protein
MQRAMASEAEAAREAHAKVISAEGDAKASFALKQAADMINQSPVALQLRYLQTLNQIAAEQDSTIVFPIPMEFVKHFAVPSSSLTPSSSSTSAATNQIVTQTRKLQTQKTFSNLAINHEKRTHVQ